MRNLLLTIALLTIPASLFAQAAPLACEGRIATVRVSELTPAGSMSRFMAAVAAHKAWYVAHGVTNDEIFATRVILRDEKTHEQTYSDKQFVSFHIHGSRAPGPKHDEAYDAFVRMYRENSEIKSEYNICMPNFPQK
jgi:hypothetical protein